MKIIMIYHTFVCKTVEHAPADLENDFTKIDKDYESNFSGFEQLLTTCNNFDVNIVTAFYC